MCLYPKLIDNPKYRGTKKNGYNPPTATDHRVKKVPIGCGRCMECIKKKAREWQVRLLEDIKEHRDGKFITLTLNDKTYAKLNMEIKNSTGYDRDNDIATLATRRFLERWRKHNKKSLRHWLVTELGHRGTENIHLHGIVYTDNIQELEQTWNWTDQSTGETYGGYVWKGKARVAKRGEIIYQNYVNEKTVGYITKYVQKMDEQHKTYKPKILTSAGIGNHYTKTDDFRKNKYNHSRTVETYKTGTGHKISLPIYWRNHAYTEDEREKLWLQKLDKQERWVNGERVSIANGEEQYYRLLKYHQERNISLGYGDDKKDWNREQYEKERRNLLRQQRIERAKTKARKKKVTCEHKIIKIYKSNWAITEHGMQLIQ